MDGVDIHGNPMISMDSSDDEENENGNERQHNGQIGSMAITVTSMDVENEYEATPNSINPDSNQQYLSNTSLHSGTYVPSKVSVKSRSATPDPQHHE